MSDPNPSAAPQTTPGLEPALEELAQLRQRVNRLRIWLFVLCGALLPLGLAVDVFLAQQFRAARFQLREYRPQVERLKADFERVREPNYRKFFEQLHAFASTNQGFQPVLDRYRPALGQYYPMVAPTPGVPGNLPPPQPHLK